MQIERFWLHFKKDSKRPKSTFTVQIRRFLEIVNIIIRSKKMLTKLFTNFAT